MVRFCLAGETTSAEERERLERRFRELLDEELRRPADPPARTWDEFPSERFTHLGTGFTPEEVAAALRAFWRCWREAHPEGPFWDDADDGLSATPAQVRAALEALRERRARKDKLARGRARLLGAGR